MGVRRARRLDHGLGLGQHGRARTPVRQPAPSPLGRSRLPPAGGRQAATIPVGSLEPNAFGLHDTVGNASEWVADTYLPGADRYAASLKNPVVNVTSSPLRVRRGGSFDDPPRLARAGARDFYAAEFAVPQTGFRLVMEEP
jgi:formylglycine-generating enzyme required for sulfatase activity